MKNLSPNAKKILLSVIVLILTAVFTSCGLGGTDSGNNTSTGNSVNTTAPVTQTSESVNAQKEHFDGYTFRSSKQLTSHFEKHGAEVGAENENEYVDMANAVINNPSAMYKTEAEDGDHVYFIKSTGEIVFLSTDGFIRTYFIADEDYFNRQ